VAADDSLNLVDPELRDLLGAFPPLSLSLDTLAQTRREGAELWRNLLAAAGPLPERGVRVEEHLVAGPPGAPRVRVLTYLPTLARPPLPARRPGVVRNRSCRAAFRRPIHRARPQASS